jgi:hypothetical protein
LDKNFNNLDINKFKYSRLGFFANSLILNKKMYLLYNILNKKKEFLFLQNKKKENRFDKNFLILNSLKLGTFYKNFIVSIKFFDYFDK